MAESQAKRHKSYIDFERKQGKCFIEFTKMETEKNQKQQLQVVHILPSAMMFGHSKCQPNACVASNSFHHFQPMNITLSPPLYSTMGSAESPHNVSMHSLGSFSTASPQSSSSSSYSSYDGYFPQPNRMNSPSEIDDTDNHTIMCDYQCFLGSSKKNKK